MGAATARGRRAEDKVLGRRGACFSAPGSGRRSSGRSGSASVERIVLGHPEQNGGGERMHHMLKAETVRPPKQTMECLQQRFDEFRRVYETTIRGARAETAGRDLSPVTTSVSRVAAADRVRRACRDTEDGGHGIVRWKNGRIFTSKILSVNSSVSRRSTTASGRLDYGPILLARFDERKMRFHG